MLQMPNYTYVENALIILESAALVYGSYNPQGLLQLVVCAFLHSFYFMSLFHVLVTYYDYAVQWLDIINSLFLWTYHSVEMLLPISK